MQPLLIFRSRYQKNHVLFIATEYVRSGTAEPAGRKWSLLVLFLPQTNGAMRFGDLQRSIGDVSQRMLTVTLRTLEADGIVERKAVPRCLRGVEYRLTDRGRSLMPYLNGKQEWAQRHADGILKTEVEATHPPWFGRYDRRGAMRKFGRALGDGLPDADRMGGSLYLI